LQVLPLGVHTPPWLHATHVLLPSQTPPAPVDVTHATPAAAGVDCSVQVATPFVHDVIPLWHELLPTPVGEQGAMSLHGLQTPP
jgi:hypothetical protein